MTEQVLGSESMTQPVEQALYPELDIGVHRIYIASENVTDQTEQIEVEYAAEGSQTSFVSHDPLDGLRGRVVTLWLGDKRYFVGTLSRPGDPQDYFSRSATALGPLARLGGLFFGEQVDYSGFTIASALYDVFLRGGFPQGSYEVRGGLGQRIQDLIFPEEVSLGEGLKAIMATGDFVATDSFGSASRAMPRPRPGATGKAVARFDEGDWPVNGFRITPKQGESYSKVVVFRRADDGSYAVRAVAPVQREEGTRPAPPNSIYYIPDFAGDADQAKQTAYDTAVSLGSGEVDFELDLLELDSGLGMYDQIVAKRNKERRDGTYRETYQLVIETGVKTSVPNWTTSLSGAGILVSERKIAAPFIVVDRLSTGVMQLDSSTVPSGVTWDDPRTFEELGPYTFEELS